jgi:hypothetical protein
MPARGHTERINKNTCQEMGKMIFIFGSLDSWLTKIGASERANFFGNRNFVGLG